MRYIYQVYTDKFMDNKKEHTDYQMHTGYNEAKSHAEAIIKERMENQALASKNLSQTMERDDKVALEHIDMLGDCLRYSVAVSYIFASRLITERVNIRQWRIR